MRHRSSSNAFAIRCNYEEHCKRRGVPILRELQIRNVALIEIAEISLEQGFTCLTGETGAGKSILLDAVGLLLGSRASVDLVRTGAEKASVEGVFDAPKAQHKLYSLFEELGIDCEDEQIVIVREISRSGKAVARVNGRIVTAQSLREIGSFLIHQHGQHDSTSLLRKEEHLELLDVYGGTDIVIAKEAYVSAYENVQLTRRKLSSAERNDKERAQRIDMLTFQLREIEEARVKGGEEVRLQALRSRLQHSEKLHSTIDDVYATVYDGQEKTPSILEELHRLYGVVDHAT